jgi:phycocyanobilin:ferredoxin oxidoreductase
VSVLELLREAEAIVTPGLRAVPGERAEGKFRDQNVELETRAYEGGPFRFARFIEVRGAALEIGNVLCLPRRDLLLPIFGADLVRIGAQPAMIAADLSPVAGENVEAVSAGRPPLPPGGELPAWARQVFSPHALYTRVSDADLDDARRAFLAFPRTLMALRAAPGDSSAAQRRYCVAHLEDDRGLQLLARMFGDAWAQRFLREVMFPV